MWNGITLISGLLLLYLGAEWLIKGAAGLGRSFGIKPLLIGLTVVAYGTSAPEFIVSLVAGSKGMSNLAIGNVIGSNLANLGLVLGLTAILAPLAVDGSLIRGEAPVMFAVSLVIPILLTDGVVSRVEGLILLVLAGLFTYAAAHSARRERKDNAKDDQRTIETDAEAAGAPPGRSRLRLAGIAVFGLILLIVGGQAFVSGAAALALAFGLSQRVVGLTVAAIGTSTPELAASIIAGLRGHPSIAVGNVIGSNIFNVLFVLGGVSAIRPINGSVGGFRLDLACLVALSTLGLILVRGPRLIRRSEGTLLVVCYVGYLYLLLRT
ncbi:MAG: calcium:sodium antiporter [Candidatus Solibacter sp.]